MAGPTNKAKNDMPLSRPALVVGVTGHMDIRTEEEDRLRIEIKEIFQFLRFGANSDVSSGKNFYIEGWTPLQNTPIIVLSSLAPGADSLVAKVALSLKAKDWPITVKAPLPFPKEIYPSATTFFPRAIGELGTDAPDPKLVADYMDLRKEIKDDDIWHVLLESDREIMSDPKAFKERLAKQATESDEESRKERHRRYRAAGEYVAGYSSILLAIWDGTDDSNKGVGTCAIINAKMKGLTPGLLPHSTGFSWTQNGPVFHLYTHRRKNTKAAKQDPTPPILYPSHLEKSNEELDYDAKRDGDEYFANQVTRLEDFNTLTCPMRGASQKKRKRYLFINDLKQTELERMEWKDCLTRKTGENPRTYELLPKDCQDAIAVLGAVRRRAANATGRLSDESTRPAVRRIFILTLSAATALHIYSHWGESSLEWQWLNDKLSIVWRWFHLPAGFSPNITINGLLLLSSLVLAVAALMVFGSYKRKGDENRDFDFRALAEGLRVQFFWAASGMDYSVPANYMQRQRSELEWVRRAISSLASPYHRWSEWFKSMNEEKRVLLLRTVRDKWLEDQFNYFTGPHGYAQEEARLESWHKFGGVLAIAGVILTLPTHFFRGEGFPFLRAITLGIFGILFIAAAIVMTHVFRSQKEQMSVTKKVSKGIRKLICCLVPNVSNGATAPKTISQVMGLLVHLPCAAALAEVFYALSFWLGQFHETKGSPEAYSWLIISIGFLLLSGAFCVAWPERNFFAEHARQYNTMALLLSAARTRMDGYLDALDELIVQMRNNSASVEAQARAKVEFEGKVKCIQELLLELGKEALDENAEWLILHRSRPLEPVFAG